ncbi:hypothetical protein BGX34_003339 [Mortierella sp. NVP85]|nr:hypothetical protein BGX34_003339 [Mortierella sp. NVP85]
MGVTGVFQYLDEKGYVPQPADTTSIRGIDIDLLSLYYSYIRSTHQRLVYETFASPPLDASQVLPRLTDRLNKKLQENFAQCPDTTIHVDGQETIQKTKTRQARAETIEKEILKFRDAIDATDEIITSDGTSPRSKKDKVVAKIAKAKDAWAKTRILDFATKLSIARGLKDLGWSVCCCTGEADTCIGKKSDTHPGLVVASTDSDMLFGGAGALLRKEPTSRSYTLYSLNDVLQKLNVTKEQWTVAAITSNNDYSANIDGQTFEKNLAIVKRSNAKDTIGILSEYCLSMGVESNRYDMAKQIFIERVETLAAETKNNQAVDQMMQSLVVRVNSCVQGLKLIIKTSKRKAKAVEPASVTGADVNAEAGTSSAQPAMDDQLAVTPVRWKRERSAVHKKNKRSKSESPKKQAMIRNPASRRARQQKDGQTEAVKSRKRNVGKMIGDVLMGSFNMTTQELGTVHRRLEHSMQCNYNTPYLEDIITHIETTIEELVKSNTDLIRIGTLITFNFINTIMAQYPLIDDADSIVSRGDTFQYLSKEKYGFFKTLVKGIYHGETGISGQGPSFETAKQAIATFKAINNMPTDAMNEVTKIMDGALPSHFLDQVGQTLSDGIRAHMRAFVSELVMRARLWNKEWTDSPQGSAFIATIDENGVSNVHDEVSVFWVLNTHIPTKKQFAFVPMSSYKDRFCAISEKQLTESILRMTPNRTLRNRMVDIFGKSRASQDRTQIHTGEFYRKLFLDGKSTNYDRQTLVANPNDDSLPRLLDLDDLPCPYKLEDLDEPDASSKTYKDAKAAIKAAIKEKVSEIALNDRERSGKYVLSGSMSTDGHQLKLQVYNLTKPRKVAGDHGSNAKRDESSSSSAQPIQVKKGYDGKTRSKMPYLIKAIPGQAARESIYGNQDEHVVLAIDPGIRNTATAVIVDSTDPNTAWNVTLPRGSHLWNNTNYTKLLNRLKKDRGINSLEATIIPFKCPDPHEVGPAKQLEGLRDSFQLHVVSVMKVEKDLRAFYGSRGLKVAAHRRKQGSRSETDRAVEGMIRPALQAAGPRRATVVVGDADFRGKKGGPVKSNKFISTLQTRATAEGMVVVCVDEYCTSITCCRCGSRMSPRGRSMICSNPICVGVRSVLYDQARGLDPKKGMIKDRDHNAGQNMADASIRWIKSFQWPEHLDRNRAKAQESSNA